VNRATIHSQEGSMNSGILNSEPTRQPDCMVLQKN
jgi:hypothetical protein